MFRAQRAAVLGGPDSSLVERVASSFFFSEFVGHSIINGGQVNGVLWDPIKWRCSTFGFPLTADSFLLLAGGLGFFLKALRRVLPVESAAVRRSQVEHAREHMQSKMHKGTCRPRCTGGHAEQVARAASCSSQRAREGSHETCGPSSLLRRRSGKNPRDLLRGLARSVARNASESKVCTVVRAPALESKQPGLASCLVSAASELESQQRERDAPPSGKSQLSSTKVLREVHFCRSLRQLDSRRKGCCVVASAARRELAHRN